MKNLLFFLLALQLGSCGLINGVGYKSLTKTQKRELTTLDTYNSIKDTTVFRLVMADGGRLKTLLQEEEYTWVYYWIPYCGSPACRPLNFYEKLAKGADKNMRLLIVSQIYDYTDVQQKLELDRYMHPILVPHIQVYGRDMYRARKHFTADLTGDKILSKHTPAHMLFRHDSLIYSGGDMTASILDSVLRQ